MKSGAILLLLLASMLIAAGCQSGGQSGPSITDTFVGGTSALKISFLPNSPPAEVTDIEKDKADSGFEFETAVTIENIGEYNIPQQGATVSMLGFFPGDFLTAPVTGLSMDIPEPKAGVSTDDNKFMGVRKDPDGNKIQGDVAQVKFPTTPITGKFKYNKVLPGNQQFPFRAEVCYSYKTQALSQVCLMKDLTGKGKTICSPTGSRQVANSGAPVHITSITQTVGGRNKLLLNFEVRKVGTSEIFKTGTTGADKCKDDFSNKDRVLVNVNTGLAGLNCLGMLSGTPSQTTTSYSGEVLLIDGAATFTCVQTLSDADRVDSLKTFSVDLGYNARDSVTTNVLVKHII